MHTEASCTVYRFSGIGFDRYFVPRCHWQETESGGVNNSGYQSADAVTVYVPLNAAVITADNHTFPCDQLFPNMDICPENSAKDIIVKGNCEFVFDNANQQTVSEGLKTLRKTHAVRTVMKIERKMYGSSRIQHIKITAG